MSVSICIAHENDDALNVGYFVEQLQKKWPETQIHFLNHADDRSLFQFETGDENEILGDFYRTCIWYYHGNSSESDAEFALWYRSIVPPEWNLLMYDSGMYFDIIHLKPETTAAEILVGFEIPFDISKYE